MNLHNILLLMPAFFQGTLVTLTIFFLTLLFSLPLGIIFVLARRSKIKVLSGFMGIFQWIIRGTPLMLQLIVVMYVPSIVFNVHGMNRFFAAILAFVINYAAYFSEIYRSGLNSIPVGQIEAASVLGLSKQRTFMRIILPQTIKRILPAMGNELMTLVKDTALAMIIGNIELLKVAQTQMSRTSNITPLFIAGIFYLIMNGIVQLSMNYTEKKLNYYQG